MRRSHFPFVAFVLLLSSTLQATNNQLTIRVTDPNSTPISAARVSLYSKTSTEALQVQPTSAEGFARFNSLPAGEYRVEVVTPGFAPHSEIISVPDNRPIGIELAIAVPSQTVFVSATRTPVPAEESGAAVEFLDQTALENMQPIAAADALRFMPGAIVNTAGRIGGLASLFVRGGESRYNKVMVDGVPINEPGGVYDFAVLPMISVERMEFVRGAESVLYGSDAMTSIVQLWSATGHTRIPELRFGADGGTFSTARGYASLSGALGHFDYNLFGEQDTTAGQGINDAYSNSTQGANLGIALSANALLRLRVRHSNPRVGIPGEWEFNEQPLLAPDSDAFARQNNALANLSLSLARPTHWQHRFSGFEYHHRRLNQDTFVDPGRGCDPAAFNFTDCFFAAELRINRAGFEYQGDWSPRNWAHSTFGYEFQDENGTADSQFLNLGPSCTLQPNIGCSHTHGLRRNHGLYAEQILLWRRFSWLGGARLEHNESFGNRGIPRTALTFLAARGGQIFAGTRLRAAYSRGIEEPTFDESFGEIGTFPADPNPNLKPEQNRAFEAGVEQVFFGGKYSASAIYYNNLFRDLIEFQSGPNFVGGQFVNIAKSIAHGAELELHGHLRRALTINAAYVYTSAQILANPVAFAPFLPGEPLIRRPKHSATLLLNYFGKRWGGELGGSFVGRRADSDFLGFGINHAAGYARVDVGGWLALNHYVTAYLNVGNVLDKRYEEVVGYPALGANVRAGLRFRVGGD